jgi:[ribosomal protein S5]-alanine N-acetyltransferase
MSDPQTVVLETERLLLRRFTLDDLDALVALYSDAAVIQYVYASMTAEETHDELEWLLALYDEQPGFGLWATIYKATGEIMGRCGLLQWTIDDRPEVELTYLLAQNYWGRGLGTEVTRALIHYGFEQLQLPRLVAVITRENEASIHVAQGLGMVFEKEVETEDGRELLYALNRETK